MKRKQSMSVSLLHALFLYKRPTAKQDGCVAAEKNPEDFSALWGLRVLPDKQVVLSGHCLQRSRESIYNGEKTRKQEI